MQIFRTRFAATELPTDARLGGDGAPCLSTSRCLPQYDVVMYGDRYTTCSLRSATKTDMHTCAPGWLAILDGISMAKHIEISSNRCGLLKVETLTTHEQSILWAMLHILLGDVHNVFNTWGLSILTGVGLLAIGLVHL